MVYSILVYQVLNWTPQENFNSCFLFFFPKKKVVYNLNVILFNGLYCNIKYNSIAVLEGILTTGKSFFLKKKNSLDFELLLWYIISQTKKIKRSLLGNFGEVKKILKVALGPFFDKSSFLLSWHQGMTFHLNKID